MLRSGTVAESRRCPVIAAGDPVARD